MVSSVRRSLYKPVGLCRWNNVKRWRTKPRCRRTSWSVLVGPQDETDKTQQGVVDIVHVEDWRTEDVGELKTRGRVRRILDNSRELPFMQKVSNFLADAEQTGSINSINSMPERDIPSFERWAFKENHYEQYLVDLLCVNKSMARAIQHALSVMEMNDIDIMLLDPVGLGLYRGEWIAKDIQQLRETRAEGYDPDTCVSEPSQFAMQYARVLDEISNVILQSSDIGKIETLISRLCAHTYMISISQLAMGNRIGSVCVERIGLIKRSAASTYTEYTTNTPPLSVLINAVNSWGEHLDETRMMEFFDELPLAASNCSMLVDSLARE